MQRHKYFIFLFTKGPCKKCKPKNVYRDMAQLMAHPLFWFFDLPAPPLLGIANPGQHCCSALICCSCEWLVSLLLLRNCLLSSTASADGPSAPLLFPALLLAEQLPEDDALAAEVVAVMSG